MANSDMEEEAHCNYSCSTEDKGDAALIAYLAENCKVVGNKAYSEHRFKDAVEAYSQAIAASPRDYILYSNRAATYLVRAS